MNQHRPYPSRKSSINIWAVLREVLFGTIVIYGLVALVFFIGGMLE